MKYENIEVGKTYLSGTNKLIVKYKEDATKQVVSFEKSIGLLVSNHYDYKHWTEKNELPYVGLVVSKTGKVLVYRTGKTTGYGFRFEEYQNHDNWSFVSNSTYWRKATQEEEQKFIELLKKEAERKGLGEDAKIKECFYHPLEDINDNRYHPRFTLKEAWNSHGCIFMDGEWATPLKNDLSEQIDELKQKAKELGLKLNITVE